MPPEAKIKSAALGLSVPIYSWIADFRPAGHKLLNVILSHPNLIQFLGVLCRAQFWALKSSLLLPEN